MRISSFTRVIIGLAALGTLCGVSLAGASHHRGDEHDRIAKAHDG